MWLAEKTCGWSRRRVAAAGGVWLEQCGWSRRRVVACGWSSRRVAGAEGVLQAVLLVQEACVWSSRLVAGAAGLSLEQPEEACNRLEQYTLAGAGGVWLEQ